MYPSMIPILFGYMTEKYLSLNRVKCSFKVIFVSAERAIERATR